MKSKLRRIDLNNIRVARSETARDINRRIVLNLVRRHQPISRAAVARRSGMQRSTVSAITEQLIAQQWVREGAVGQLPLQLGFGSDVQCGQPLRLEHARPGAVPQDYGA